MSFQLLMLFKMFLIVQSAKLKREQQLQQRQLTLLLAVDLTLIIEQLGHGLISLLFMNFQMQQFDIIILKVLNLMI